MESKRELSFVLKGFGMQKRFLTSPLLTMTYYCWVMQLIHAKNTQAYFNNLDNTYTLIGNTSILLFIFPVN